MKFLASSPRRSDQDRAIVPMINVVFLLLIFFLMTASLTAPPPLDISAPVVDAEQTDRQPMTLYIDAQGTLAFESVEGDAVFAALAAQTLPDPLPVHADANFPAADLATLLPELVAAGVERVELITELP